MKGSRKHRQPTRRRVRLKRTYEPAEPSDGLRVLVDRLWPRGLRKDEAQVDLWLKEIAPSAELRRWFGHDPARWEAFQRKYREEWRDRAELLQTLQDALHRGPVTLLFAARDREHNDAVVLKDVLDRGRQARRRHPISVRTAPDTPAR
ncbi:MAG: DUF488 family protein [Alphaproteobacteria bacterium]|nr:DUF488 family protein [Alphaproteobacteria bacterium]